MTPLERRIMQRVQRRASSLSPALQVEFVRGLAILAERLAKRNIQELAANGLAESVIAEALDDQAIDTALSRFRARLQRHTQDSVEYYGKTLPTLSRAASIDFNVLNPRVIDAIRQLDSVVMRDMKDAIQSGVREIIEAGLRDGRGPRAIARDLRTMVGLSESQVEQVNNWRDAVQGKNGRSILDYTKRDRRFDGRILKALSGEGPPLTATEIEKYVGIYRQRRVNLNAETTARSAMLDSNRLGQRLAYEDAIEKGILERDRLMKRRLVVDDERTRDEHDAMRNETVPFDSPYSNGEMISGEDSYNCRCVDFVFQARSAA